MNKKISIFGTGGYAKEVLEIINLIDHLKIESFVVSDQYFEYDSFQDYQVLAFTDFVKKPNDMVIAIGDSSERKKIIDLMPSEVNFPSIIDPRSTISNSSRVGEGSIVSAGALISTDVKIGCHAQINFHSTIGHDCDIGNFFTSSPGVRVSGNCTIGNEVFLGTNSSLKQNIKVEDCVFVGMGSVVITDIERNERVFGNPARKMKKK